MCNLSYVLMTLDLDADGPRALLQVLLPCKFINDAVASFATGHDLIHNDATKPTRWSLKLSDR